MFVLMLKKDSRHPQRAQLVTRLKAFAHDQHGYCACVRVCVMRMFVLLFVYYASKQARAALKDCQHGIRPLPCVNGPS